LTSEYPIAEWTELMWLLEPRPGDESDAITSGYGFRFDVVNYRFLSCFLTFGSTFDIFATTVDSVPLFFNLWC